MAIHWALAATYLIASFFAGFGGQAPAGTPSVLVSSSMAGTEKDGIRAGRLETGNARPSNDSVVFGVPATATVRTSLNDDTLSDELFQGASIGTAWPLPSGFVVTNSHVVAGCGKIELWDQNGTRLAAWPVLRDEVTDLAVLQVAEPQKLPAALPLADTRSRLGSSVFTIGFPRIDVMGRTPKLANGVISGLMGLRDDPCSYQTTVPIQPGNSGGPIFNMNGEVVGIVASMVGIRDEASGAVSPLPNISCAVKIECLKELFPHLPSLGTVLTALPRDPGDLESVAQRVQDSILIVVAK